MLVCFYHAILCIARTLLSQDVCPSVCLSHTSVLSKRLNISGNLLTGASNAGDMKISRFTVLGLI